MSDCPVALAEVTRGALVESVHYGSLAVADTAGRVVASVGAPERVCYFRSSAKPLQAALVVLSGAADRFAFTAEELAIACASHHGSARHVAVVSGILDKLGLGPEALQCGSHAINDAEEARRLIREGLEPTPLHNNCSGKHAGMLAAALAMGADVEGYLSPEHPVQSANLSNVARFCGLSPEEVVIGVDGCGVPTFGVPLRAAATAFARLATGEGLDDDLAAATERIRQAMWAAPDMISAPGAFNSELLRVLAGRVVAKGGAEGLYCVGNVHAAEGLAIKSEGGSFRGLHEAMVTAMVARWPELDDGTLDRWRQSPVKNARGEHVGDVRPVVPVEPLRPVRP
ncbi:MAG: asparaginase [Armatimonadetes bacterium]|nr:asparaginase [Armatimonadota bacterium]